ncbi:MAG: hypothetical protein GY714_18730 [Desulfobacterales bacterium]|nr:hypothetical protein [Desulfobacterales bacterium]MCP4163477.1 hypothetical protein [Deltaproteobacteria bacterium]
MRTILICILFTFLLGCLSRTSHFTKSSINSEAMEPIHTDYLKIVIKKVLPDTGPNTFAGDSSVKDGYSLLIWLGGKDKIDKILIGPSFYPPETVLEKHVREIFIKSVSINSLAKKWHYTIPALGIIYLKNGQKVNFEMYFSTIKVGGILFAKPTK